MLSRVFVVIPAAAAGGFGVLVLIGLWDRYESESGALGFRGAYERLAWEAGLSGNLNAGAEPEQGQLVSLGRGQHAAKLVGAGARADAYQGTSVALSADGTVAVVGGPGSNNADRDRSPRAGPVGAAWVFTRSGSTWTQQGSKLIGTMSENGGGLWSQGYSVALSADGNTAIVGGPSDNNTSGAAWVFSRNNGDWTQQGGKLVGAGGRSDAPAFSPGQGTSVALSADGDTALIGGWHSEGAWVFTRKNGVWTQQGNKLIGSGALGDARLGMSVALSADGSTAILGGWSDNNKAGAAWIFSRSNNGAWTQQGKKLVGSGAAGRARQGTSVALSADGNTALVGGPGDNPSDRFGVGPTGAAWVFTRQGGVWNQQGHKLTVSGGAWTQQGTSIALSADGNLAVISAFVHERNAGAAVIFIRNGDEWMQEKEFAGHSGVGRTAPAVAVSADGGFVLLGEPDDNGGRGAALVFARTRAGAS